MNYTGEIEVKEGLVGNLNMLKVINGYSAYELALKCGYKGTLEEWLESLKVKGEPGTMELFGELDAKGERIMNVADPEEDGDAVNLKSVKDKLSIISKPVEAVLAKREVYGEYSYVYFDVEAEWLDYDNLPNGFELTIIPNAQNSGDFTLLRINGGKYVSVKLTTHGNITFDSFAAGIPHKLLYFCGGRFDNGNKIDDWYSVTALSEVLRNLSRGSALPIKNGGTGGKTAEEARNNIGAASLDATLIKDVNTDVDELTDSGRYFVTANNSPFINAYIEVERAYVNPGSEDFFCLQKAFDSSRGVMAMRFSGSRTFSGYEWVYENPQLEIDTEYLTTQCWLGKPVYTKLFKFDWNANRNISLGDIGTVISYNGYVGVKTLPHIYGTTDNENSMWVTFSRTESGATYMQMHGSAASYGEEGYIQVRYIKE